MAVRSHFRLCIRTTCYLLFNLTSCRVFVVSCHRVQV